MFRIVAVSVTLVLASGQSSALVCGLRCQERTTAATCHHETPAARFSVAAASDCSLLTSDVFLRDDTRNGLERLRVNAGPVPHVVPSADAWFSQLPAHHAAGHDSSSQAAVGHHPPPLVLRI